MDRNEGSRIGDISRESPKKFCGETSAGVFFRPFAVVGSQIGEGKKKKNRNDDDVWILGFGLQQAARNVWLTS